MARKLGRFELADQGTLFLDEIGELPLDLQAKLLRVLRDGELDRVGGVHPRKVDVRVLATTNRDLAREVQDRRFREDLCYRLNVVPLRAPPLRERADDIGLLVEYFVAKYSRKVSRPIAGIHPQVLAILRNYSWPGNVRELEHVIERGVILSRTDQLDPWDWLPRKDERPAILVGNTLEAHEREYIVATLEATGWKVSGAGGAAARLGLKATTLEARMRKLGIERPHSKP